MNTKKYISIAVGLATAATIGGLGLAMTVSAATAAPTTSSVNSQYKGGMHNRTPGVFGTVSAISGDTITLASKGFGKTATATTYTVDASSATVTKSGATSSVSGIAVGDTIAVQGTISGTSVTATSINDGQFNKGGMNGMQDKNPGVFGTVSVVNGNMITVTSKGFGKTATATTYTVDATNATVTKNNTAGTVSAIAVGDTVMVQGTVSGTSVTATAIHDGVMGKTSGTAGTHARNGVVGTVSAVNGTTLTVTSKVGPKGGTATTYTVNASSATVTKNGAASSVSNIATGDTVMVRGTITGSNITATTIRDGLVTRTKPTSTN